MINLTHNWGSLQWKRNYVLKPVLVEVEIKIHGNSNCNMKSQQSKWIRDFCSETKSAWPVEYLGFRVLWGSSRRPVYDVRAEETKRGVSTAGVGNRRGKGALAFFVSSRHLRFLIIYDNCTARSAESERKKPKTTRLPDSKRILNGILRLAGTWARISNLCTCMYRHASI